MVTLFTGRLPSVSVCAVQEGTCGGRLASSPCQGRGYPWCVCVLIFLLGVRSGKFSTISLPSVAAFTIDVTISFIFRETLDASSILCGSPACRGCIGVAPGGIINEAPSSPFILSVPIQERHFSPGSFIIQGPAASTCCVQVQGHHASTGKQARRWAFC